MCQTEAAKVEVVTEPTEVLFISIFVGVGWPTVCEQYRLNIQHFGQIFVGLDRYQKLPILPIPIL